MDTNVVQLRPQAAPPPQPPRGMRRARRPALQRPFNQALAEHSAGRLEFLASMVASQGAELKACGAWFPPDTLARLEAVRSEIETIAARELIAAVDAFSKPPEGPRHGV